MEVLTHSVSLAGVTIKEALRTSRTAQGQNLQMFPSVVCKEGVLLPCYCFSCPFSLGVLLHCISSYSVLRIAEFPGRAQQIGEEGSFFMTFPFSPPDRRVKTFQGKEFYYEDQHQHRNLYWVENWNGIILDRLWSKKKKLHAVLKWLLVSCTNGKLNLLARKGSLSRWKSWMAGLVSVAFIDLKYAPCHTL